MANKLLKKSEQNTCEKIAASGTGLEAKRAAALLALTEGATQTAAATKTGLTLGQVRYLLAIFREKGTSIFTTATTSKPAAKASTAKAKKGKTGKDDKKKAKKDKSRKKKEKGGKKKGKKSKKKK